jgi:signal transduction histidine kinase
MIFADERRAALRMVGREQVLTRTAGLVRLLEETPEPLHGRILETSSGGLVRFAISDRGALADEADWREHNPVARRLRGLLDGNRGRLVLADFPEEPGLRNLARFALVEEARGRPKHWPPRRHRPPPSLILSVQLGDGRWLDARTFTQPPPSWALPSLVTLGLSATLVALGVLLAVRRVTRPMTRLAAAADALGRGESPPPLAEAGPDDIRATVAAFNRMQARLRRFLDDRTRMLAAVGHDLRTPITSLRLRAEFVEDEETRTRILATLDEMQAMVEATLAFAREEARSEPTRIVDLAALVESTAADLADLGAAIEVAPADRLPYACRPAALRRALRNLLENAVRYGERCQVRLERDRSEVRILIEDEGPGIPEDLQEQVFEPFVRLEESRSGETGGIGLGLAIARSIARAHGGDITLCNLPRRGLRVSLSLPPVAPGP